MRLAEPIELRGHIRLLSRYRRPKSKVIFFFTVTGADDWPYRSFHRYVKNAVLAMAGVGSEPCAKSRRGCANFSASHGDFSRPKPANPEPNRSLLPHQNRSRSHCGLLPHHRERSHSRSRMSTTRQESIHKGLQGRPIGFELRKARVVVTGFAGSPALRTGPWNDTPTRRRFSAS